MSFREISLMKTQSFSGTYSSSIEESINSQSDIIESLNQAIESMKITIGKKDTALNMLTQERDKIYLELKNSQISKRNLQQQLIDEREIHSKEKNFLVNELKRLSKYEKVDSCFNHKNKLDQYYIKGDPKYLQEEIRNKDVIIYKLCSKYIKVKRNEVVLKKEIRRSQVLSGKAYEQIIVNLEENRALLDNILRKLLITTALPSTNKKYLKLLQITTSLQYENTQLKVCLLAPSNTLLCKMSRDYCQRWHKYICHKSWIKCPVLNRNNIYYGLHQTINARPLSSSHSDTWVPR